MNSFHDKCLTVPATAFDFVQAPVRMQGTSENITLSYSVQALELSDRVDNVMSNIVQIAYKLASDIKRSRWKLEQVPINLTPISFPDTCPVFLCSTHASHSKTWKWC